MRGKIAGDCPSAIVGLLGPENEYLGTGFFISPRLIMTCEHVVMGTSAVRARRLVGGSAMSCRLIETDSDRDLALLRLEEGDEEREPIRPLLGLQPDLLRQYDGRLTSIGVEATTGKPLRLDNLALRLVVGSLGVENDLVREAQITGGAPPGLSGAPVFAMAPGAARPCVGMMVLGGSDSGQSLLHGPDAMVPLWQRAGVLDEIESLRAKDVLARPLVRGSGGSARSAGLATSFGQGSALASLPATQRHEEQEGKPDPDHPDGAAQLATLDEASGPLVEVAPSAAELDQARTRRRRTIAVCMLLASGVGGLTFTILRRSGQPAAPPPAWVANELFPGVRELQGFAEDLEQFSRVYLLPPKNHLGHRQQIIDLNKTIQLYNCTSDYLSAGKNFFRDRLATLPSESLKNLVVRISESRFPARYTPMVYRAPTVGPIPPGEPSASETLRSQFQNVVTTWSEHATHLDGPIRETRAYLAALEESLLHELDLSTPRCPP